MSKLTSSQIFKAAHQIAKATRQPGDDYRITFSAALKLVLLSEQGAANPLRQPRKHGTWLSPTSSPTAGLVTTTA